MAKANKRIARTRKTRKTISTVKQAITAYGGLKAMAESFRMSTAEDEPNSLHLWNPAQCAAAWPSAQRIP
jgi:hypothetical protein